MKYALLLLIVLSEFAVNAQGQTRAPSNSATSNLVTKTGTETIANKRITPRTGTVTSSATPTINTDNVSYFSITALTVDITSFTTNLSGTPVEGQTMWIVITSSGGSRAITWGTSFESSTVALPTSVNGTIDIGLRWNPLTTKWRCIASQ